MSKLSYISGLEFFGSDLYKQLSEVLNIDNSLPTREVIIRIPYDGVIEITQTYLAKNELPKPWKLSKESYP